MATDLAKEIVKMSIEAQQKDKQTLLEQLNDKINQFNITIRHVYSFRDEDGDYLEDTKRTKSNNISCFDGKVYILPPRNSSFDFSKKYDVDCAIEYNDATIDIVARMIHPYSPCNEKDAFCRYEVEMTLIGNKGKVYQYEFDWEHYNRPIDILDCAIHIFRNLTRFG
jgi:hypothetical protein